jgi:Response regulator containing CheY-like receiver domain and AraC-type DNA-binding domain
MSKKSNSYFIRMLLFGLLISALPVVIVGFFSYMKTSDTIQRQAHDSKLQQLRQIQTNVEQLMKTVDHSMTYFVNSALLKSTMLEPLTVDQFQLFNQIRKEVNHLQTFDTGIENFILLSTAKDWYIDNSGLYRLHEIADRDKLLDYFANTADSLWLAETPEEAAVPVPSAKRCGVQFNLVKKLPLTSAGKHGLAMASIPSCTISELISYDKSSETVLILDDRGRTVLHENAGLLPETAYPILYREIGRSASVHDQFRTVLKEGEYSVTFRKSDYNGWTYVSIISVKELTKDSRSIGWFTGLICLALLLLALLATWIGSHRLYRPVGRLLQLASQFFPSREKRETDDFTYLAEQIRRVVQEKTELKERIEAQAEQVKALFTMKLVQGGHALGRHALRERIVSLGYPVPSGGYAVAALRIDTLDGTPYEPKDVDLLLFAVNNIVEEIIPADERFTPVILDQSQVTLVVNRQETDRDTFLEALNKKAATVQAAIRQVLQLSVSFGISGVHTEPANANNALLEALEALKHRIRLGDSAIVFYRDLPQKYALATYFPAHLQSELNDAIKLADRRKTDEVLNELFGHLFRQRLGPHDFELWTARMLIDLIHLSHSLGIHYVEFADNPSLFDHLFRLRSPKEIRSWFREAIIEPLICAIEERTASQYRNISERIIRIIHEEFDRDITLEGIAARLHYNPNYISGVFRKETGISFSEYLARHRHRIAVRWLTETEMSVKEISEKLRYNNAQNFIRSFRKMEGVTPGKYRETYGA